MDVRTIGQQKNNVFGIDTPSPIMRWYGNKYYRPQENTWNRVIRERRNQNKSTYEN